MGNKNSAKKSGGGKPPSGGASRYMQQPANDEVEDTPRDTTATPSRNDSKQEYGNLSDFDRDYSGGVGTQGARRRQNKKRDAPKAMDPELQMFAESLKKKQRSGVSARRRTPGKARNIMMGGVHQLPGTLRQASDNDVGSEPDSPDTTRVPLRGVAAALERPAAGGFALAAHPRRPR